MNSLSWKKLGRPFIPSDSLGISWLQEFAQAPSMIVEKDYVRAYFSCRQKPDQNGQYVSRSAYVDLDKNNLLKVLRFSQEPILELGNVGEFDEFGTYPVSVIKSDKKYIAYYGGWTRCESVPFNVAIGCAESFDEGNTFQKKGAGPILSYSPDEPFILSGPKIRFFNKQWYLFYISGTKWKLFNERPEPVYKIRMATSKDGIHWSRLNKQLIVDKVENDEAQASPDVFYSNGIYHMFFCYRYSTDYRNKERGYRIGYAHSTNLIDWTRNDAYAGLQLSEEGWDSEMLSYPHIFSVENKLYMAYLGNQVGRLGFGIAELQGQL